jgi:uncharacterized protein (DUF4415 family)
MRGRLLKIAFTVRESKIRVIPARAMNKKKGHFMKHKHKTVRKMTGADEAGSDIAKSRAVIFPRLKPARRPVTVRVPTLVLDKITAAANRRGSRYQSMINEWLAERADTEFNRAA